MLTMNNNPEEFIVTEDRKALWKVEMDIATVLLELCDRYGLRIWAAYGTLLGAVRHSGFIPWDDDMDFVMLREDYDKLFYLAQQEGVVPEPYEFDIVDGAIIRLCNKDTTMLNALYKLDMNKKYGVWVDILCLDKAPDQMTPNVFKTYEAFRKRVRIINNGKNYCYLSNPGIRFKIGHLYCRLCLAARDVYEVIESLMKDVKECADTFSGGGLWNFTEQCKELPSDKIKTYNSDWYNETVMLPFESMYIPCPGEYEKCLVSEFGDNWRTPIMGGSWHEGIIIDIQTPYKFYIAKRIKELSLLTRFLKHF